MTFQESLDYNLSHPFEASGRASRSEFWWYMLALFGSFSVFDFIYGFIISLTGFKWLSILIILMNVGAGILAIFPAIRRVRDTGFSPFLLLLGLIPYVGAIACLILCCLNTDTRSPKKQMAMNAMASGGNAMYYSNQNDMAMAMSNGGNSGNNTNNSNVNTYQESQNDNFNSYEEYLDSQMNQPREVSKKITLMRWLAAIVFTVAALFDLADLWPMISSIQAGHVYQNHKVFLYLNGILMIAGWMILYLISSTNKSRVAVLLMVLMNIIGFIVYNIIGDVAPYVRVLMTVLWLYTVTVFIVNSCDSNSARWAFLILMATIPNLCITVYFNHYGVSLMDISSLEVGLPIMYLVLACAIFAIFCYWNIAFSEPFSGQDDEVSMAMTSSFGEALLETNYSPINKYGLAYLVGIAFCFILF